MPIKGKKESKQRAIKAPQTSGTTAKGALAALVTPSPELGSELPAKHGRTGRCGHVASP